MEYFKVKEKSANSTMEVNRDEFGDFNFRLINNKDKKWMISLSATEARDLAHFIGKRLSEKKPSETNCPF